jgi:hypothetical protein
MQALTRPNCGSDCDDCARTTSAVLLLLLLTDRAGDRWTARGALLQAECRVPINAGDAWALSIVGWESFAWLMRTADDGSGVW